MDFSYRTTVVICHGQHSFSFSIAARSSSLTTRAAHLHASGFHLLWSSSVLTGFLPSTSSLSSPLVPVATPTNVIAGMSSSLVVPSFVPVFFSTSFSSIAPCLVAVYRLPTTINTALASQPVRWLPCREPYLFNSLKWFGPGY